MNAIIQPLSGKKYYGTVITFEKKASIVSQFPGTEERRVWFTGDGMPSERQLSEWGMSIDEAIKGGIISDSLGHYETQLSFDVAQAIVKFMNEERRT